jgi:hypothetical protein
LENAISDLENRVSELEGISDNVASEGLVLWLPMDEGQGSVVVEDKSEFGNDGTIVGATWVSINGTYALSFDGTDDQIVIPDDSSLKPTEAITVVVWANIHTTSEKSCGLVSKAPLGSSYGDWDLQLSGGTTPYIHINNNGKSVGAANALTLGHWYHIVATYDRAYLRLYINTIEETAKAYSTALATSTNTVKVGLFYVDGPTRYFPGIIGEIMVYNRALTPQEIQQNYLATKWRYQ